MPPLRAPPHLTTVEEKSIIVIHGHAQSRVRDYRAFRNFKRLPKLADLPVERFLRPNPIPKTICTIVAQLCHSNGTGLICRLAGLAMARENPGQPQSQKANCA